MSAAGAVGSAGTTNDPVIDQPIPSTARPNGTPATAVPDVAPAIAGAAGTWKTSHGIAAAISSTAEWVAGGSGILAGVAVSSLLPFANDSVPTQTMQMLSPLVQPGVAGVQARGVF